MSCDHSGCDHSGTGVGDPTQTETGNEEVMGIPGTTEVTTE